MGRHGAAVSWERGDARFLDGRYSRAHVWTFDGGAEVRASASPNVVPPPLSDPAGVDPEEAFVAAISSCHMLWFLSFAAKRGFLVDRYHDRPDGVLEPDARGRLAMTRVTLRPHIEYGGTQPTPADETEMHAEAHLACFIANSVRTEVVVATLDPETPAP